MILTLKGRKIVGGRARGEALISKEAISFFGGIDVNSGKIIERGHELKGASITGKVFIFPQGKGSTVGSYIIYTMTKSKTAPVAIINVRAEPIIATGCCLAGIPLVDELNKNPLQVIKTGDFVEVFADEGLVKVKKN